MPEARKKPCRICRRWFRPDPRVGVLQRSCGNADCQTARRQRTQANWRSRNPGYAIAWRIDQRAAQTQSPPEPMRLPAPLNQLPWEFAKDQFGPQRADFIGVMGALMVRSAKDQFLRYPLDSTRLSGTLPLPSQKTSSGLGHTEPADDHATWSFTNSTGDGNTCEPAGRSGSGA